jgi:mono/diheme cytochrome c family protein
MSRIIIEVSLAVFICLAWSCAKKGGDHGPSSSTDTVVAQGSAIEGGEVLYESKCSMCHGSDGTAGIAGAANLQMTPLDSVALERVIADGRNAMPAFKSSLSETEIRHLAGYVMTLKNK